MDSIKKLCKFLQSYLIKSESCEFVEVYFKDFSSNQLYTIAFAEDEDFETNSLQAIHSQQKKIATLVEQLEKELYELKKIKKLRQNQSLAPELLARIPTNLLVQFEREKLKLLKLEFENTKMLRDQILTESQRVYIACDSGITGQCYQRQKVNYFNNFNAGECIEWCPETDDMRGRRNINNFVFMPLIGFDGQSNGVIQMINFKNNLTRLQIRKYAALSKFLGCSLDRVILSTSAMTTCLNSHSTISEVDRGQQRIEKVK